MLLQADAFRIPLSDKSIHSCVMSPPYWGLRRYQGEQGRIWGGDPECEHKWNPVDRKMQTGGVSTKQQSNRGITGEGWIAHSSYCEKCNAWYGGLGLEPTPDLHIMNMVEIFREIWRVLRDDGVVWLNLGDCYSGVGGDNFNKGIGGSQDDRDAWITKSIRRTKYKGGNLMLMPHRLAIALQDDGWIVRNDLVWFKRNPMPESVAGWRWEREKKRNAEFSPTHYGGKGEDPRGRTERLKMNVASARAAGIDHETGAVGMGWEYGDDYVLRRSSWRHTRAHEYIFQLVKGMGYYCNQEAVREANTSSAGNREQFRGTAKAPDNSVGYFHSKEHTNDGIQSGRNPRSVLDVPTAPYKGSHFATFPANLIAPLIRASVPRRCCPECGQAWAPVVERHGIIPQYETRHGGKAFGGDVDLSETWKPGIVDSSIMGYRPTCEHYPDINDIEIPEGLHPNQEDEFRLWFINENWEHVPGIVCDPFGGSGTTGMVAKQLLRRWVVMDISRPYLDEQAKIRTSSGMPSKGLEDLPLFMEVERGQRTDGN